jgi:alpha-amylase
MIMKRFLLSLSVILLIIGCTTPSTPLEPSVDRLSIAELQEILAESNAQKFNDEVFTAYSLFPIAFADSNGDKVGDLRGIIEKLDYLNDGDPTTDTDLGIDAIWLNPIHPSKTYHKYDVKDFYGIDPSFGTLDDFKELLEEAHKRGIKIILDMVFNHTSSEHPWFLKALLKEEPYFSYYNIHVKVDFSEYPGRSGWNIRNGLTYYSAFWSEMPELNPENELVRDELKAILDFWIDLGVDGFRYDAAKHMYDPNEYPKGTPIVQLNKQFWMEMKAHAKERNPDIFLIGEVWVDSTFAAPLVSGFDSIFNFDVQTAMVNMVRSEYQSNFISLFNSTLTKFYLNNPNFINATFLSNHDQNRIMSQLSNSDPKMRLAAHILFTLPGIPFIYYGEELGMLGVKPDEKIREPFRWTAEPVAPNAMWTSWTHNLNTSPYEQQVKDPQSLWSMYRDLIRTRRELPILKFGDLSAIDFGSNRILGYQRQDEQKTIWVIHNLSGQSIDLNLDRSGLILLNHGNNILSDNSLKMQAYGSIILEMND